ncbi:nucleolar GTP-binding protein 1-like [Pyrus ussuriensis x Pyrus communis]|uniref:Nucleolar GTP-binding protein 1-like n=1 Tax=Pyrus ussuriensis x Pyrus communis TaxID=2448454 RepID=A0A5N5GKV5_9ROSA|nr:nucleolar GTP-binding protein 1-like [Pyrus ussuriensis x Pyrus communis]
MVQYNFKKMTVVPNGKDFIDIILSPTQRQTPTVVHKGYMPFPAFVSSICGNLLHVLYNKDHYKLALGQINTARNLIGKISKDSEIVEVAALGRMCMVIKRIDPSLAYLEQIRQHVARLRSIDPNTMTVLICGYPNVGKSSFINKITRADVDVQPYAFTTKSLFSLAHLSAAALFFLDISGSCGYNNAQQTTLFHSIKSLFMNKPLIIVCNKTDLQPFDGISEEDKKLVAEMKNEAMKTVVGQGGEAKNDEGVLLTMSTLIDEGVMSVKNAACERLLNQRVELKMKSKRINDCLNFMPLCIPQVVLEAQSKQAVEKEKRSTERDLKNENDGVGVYSASLNKHYIFVNDEWKEDFMPENLDGHNVYDFVDPDILHRLEELEREERLRQEEDGDDDFEMDWN